MAGSTTSQQLAAETERQIEKASVVIDDAAVTAKGKTAFIVAPDLRGFAIDVDTLRNVVTLSGVIASDDLRQQAERLAKSVERVKDVKNNLMVKQPS
jgi:hyperosmotically inducible protein